MWPDGSLEPATWNQQCTDSSPTRRVSGTVGVWSMRLGTKYWDDLAVTGSEEVCED